jgi:hypothetical protein
MYFGVAEKVILGKYHLAFHSKKNMCQKKSIWKFWVWKIMPLVKALAPTRGFNQSLNSFSLHFKTKHCEKNRHASLELEWLKCEFYPFDTVLYQTMLLRAYPCVSIVVFEHLTSVSILSLYISSLCFFRSIWPDARARIHWIRASLPHDAES